MNFNKIFKTGYFFVLLSFLSCFSKIDIINNTSYTVFLRSSCCVKILNSGIKLSLNELEELNILLIHGESHITLFDIEGLVYFSGTRIAVNWGVSYDEKLDIRLFCEKEIVDKRYSVVAGIDTTEIIIQKVIPKDSLIDNKTYAIEQHDDKVVFFESDYENSFD